MSYHEALEAALHLKQALLEIDALIEQQIASVMDEDNKRLGEAA